MPVHLKKIGKRWRLVDRSGKIEKTAAGKPRDGGGWSDADKKTGNAQVAIINGYVKRD